MNTPDAERLAGWFGLTPDELAERCRERLLAERCRERLTTEAEPRPIETTRDGPPAAPGATLDQVAVEHAMVANEHADIDLDPYYREMQLVNGTRLRR